MATTNRCTRMPASLQFRCANPRECVRAREHYNRGMKKGQGSRTADRVAERRAAHQVRDRPLVLDDPIALRLIRPEVAHELRTNPPAREATRLGPYLRAFFVMRSRFAEDALAAAVAAGVRQY